jgi:hypothetical protein
MTHEGAPIGGTGRRLISVAEAAEIFRVTEDALRDWIATDRISYVTLPDGEHRLELIDEWHSHPGPVGQGITMIKTNVGNADAASRKEFRVELARQQREKQLTGLDAGEIDVDALTAGTRGATCRRRAVATPRDRRVGNARDPQRRRSRCAHRRRRDGER